MLIVFLAVPSTLSSELAIISSPGYSNFVAFHCNAVAALKVDDSDDATDSIAHHCINFQKILLQKLIFSGKFLQHLKELIKLS